MKEISNLISYRPDIKVVDATLRDGGLVNDFYFTDEFVRALYLTNLRAGVDYMEFGYKSSKEMFDVNKFGKWKFCNDEDIRAIVGDNATDLKIAVMADVGRCDYKTDIIDRADSPIDLIRVATYLNAIPTAVDMIEDAAKKGYEVSCNIMAISNAQEGDLRAALEMLAQTPVDVLYIVDSYGAMYPEQVARLADLYVEIAAKYGKKVGIHAHNNQQLAFANTIEAVGDGVDWLDATYSSMGRGAGNCAMELLLGFLRNPKYNVYPAIQFIDSHMNKLKEDGVVWGYDLQYLVTGLLNQHPRTAIRFTKDKRKDYAEFYREVVVRDGD
ncbi:MAG: aldolase catalytic domain-containing protein [Eubacterium sp.]|nr:aldolase catalytic domain-containing protein [Eubacterium sp.]MCM1216943.1 aldolase catalytic domain-containing protein [Lachnospiraceae bacterium]MCM1303984.1 aldolase catalytic domain-containing protein [Butyrivibrio sp.]MCM1344826.1 aldolase catalytic domain-containing protein [Muribaculaceae bacterium]MCM1240652.1 aldolase catalytic domain-containing protein [Lachnospiraceae bacterium]